MQVPNEETMIRSFRAAQIKLGQLTRALPVRSDLHLIRKIWHMTMGLIIVSVFMSGISQSTALSLLGGFLLWSITMETLRLKNPELNEKCVRFFGPGIRSHEVNKVSGMPYYIASSLFAIAVFP